MLQKLINNLHNFEEQSGQINKLVNFFNGKDKTYIELLCTGKCYLPTPDLLRKTIELNKDLLAEDGSHIEKILKETIILSENFYEALTYVALENIKHNTNFNEIFEFQAQPLGQKVISNLKMIKYHIELRKIYAPKFKLNSTSTFSKKLRALWLRKYHMRLKFREFIAYKPRSAYNAYILLSTSIAISLSAYVFIMALSYLTPLTASILSLITMIAVSIFAIAKQSIKVFDYRDMEGVNVLALEYKAFFNSIYTRN